MWFLPLRAAVTRSGVYNRGYPVWFMRLVRKLLRADATTRALLRECPFGDQAPQHIRASFYSYRMTTAAERKSTGEYWNRSYIGEYLPALSRGANADVEAHE